LLLLPTILTLRSGPLAPLGAGSGRVSKGRSQYALSLRAMTQVASLLRLL
jgi:hypothetical protein